MIIGASEVKTTTVEKTEIVNYFGANGKADTAAPFKKVNFIAKDDCTISINGGDDIYIPQDMGVNIEERVDSFVVNGVGVRYLWIATI